MYNPPHFQEQDPDIITHMIDSGGLATLVSNGADGVPDITHLPLILDQHQGPHGTLYGHFAKANPHWQKLQSANKAIAVFSGPDAYISPNWYANKPVHHKVVPTWNYEVVHALCTVEIFADPERLLALVTRLTEFHERSQLHPWAINQAPEDFIAAKLKGIVGVGLHIESIEAKRKLSQNQQDVDRAGVRNALALSTHSQDRLMAEHMDELENNRPKS